MVGIPCQAVSRIVVLDPAWETCGWRVWWTLSRSVKKGKCKEMRKLTYAILTCLVLASPAKAGGVLFDFNNGPIHAPLPLDLTVDGITAHFSATGDGYSIQDTQQVIGVLPTGFTG